MTAHRTISALRILKIAPFLRPLVSALYKRSAPTLNKELMGMSFTGSIGVAAGVDKRGEYTDVIACYSPSFIEIGPLRNVMHAIPHLQNRSEEIHIFGNLSNTRDIERSFSLIYDFVDAIVLNVSLNTSVSKVIEHLLELRRYNDTYKPIIFKLNSDLTPAVLDQVAHYMLLSGIDAVMVQAASVPLIREKTLGLMPVIAVAEITAPEQAAALLDTGADLIAISNDPSRYGPALIKRINKYLEKR
jgi:dihydroorotate dehydrogenase